MSRKPYAIIAVQEPVLEDFRTEKVAPFVTYLVTGVDPHGQFQVRRRFREFLLLRNKLVERFLGIYVPPIPSKRAAVPLPPPRATPRRDTSRSAAASCTTSACALPKGPSSSTPTSSRPSCAATPTSNAPPDSSPRTSTPSSPTSTASSSQSPPGRPTSPRCWWDWRPRPKRCDWSRSDSLPSASSCWRPPRASGCWRLSSVPLGPRRALLPEGTAAVRAGVRGQTRRQTGAG